MKNYKEDKWLLVSCLQKSIRKGFSELAQEYAEQLFELDRSYLVYRLSIIALEDVGLGNIDLVHDLMSTEIKKTSIDERGGKDYIINVVKELAQSTKDRSACDLTALSSFYQEKMQDETKSKEQIFVDDTEPIVNRLLAGWEILGSKKIKNPLVANMDNDNLENFVELNQKIIQNKKVIDILRNGYLIHREPHFIALGLLQYLFDKEKNKGLKIGKYATGDFVEKKHEIKLVNNKWLLDGIDWHTKEGKSAIYDFCTMDIPTIKYLKTMVIDIETIASIIGMLLFRHNGHQVNKRLVYPSAIVIMKMTEKMTFKQMTNNINADFFEAINYFEKDVHLLYQKIEGKLKTPDPKYFPF